MLDATTVLKRHPDVRFRVLDGEAVVVHQGSAEVLVFDEVATRILSLADGEAPVARWLEILGAEYEVAADVLAKDVHDFAEELLREGFLESVSP